MRLKKIAKDTNAKITKLLGNYERKAKLYDNIMEHMNKIVIDVDKVNLFVNNDGKIGVQVDYKVEPVKIFFDDNNNIIENSRFIAMNYLDLIPADGMKKVQVALTDAKRRNII